MAHANLWVGGLPQGIDDSTLAEFFSSYGTIVSTRLMAEKRYAFVKFSQAEEAEAAIAALNGAEVGGSSIIVKRADNDQGARAAAGGYGKAASNVGMAAAAPNTNLYIKGLPGGMTEENVKETFGSYGTVTSAKVLDSSGKGTDGSAMSVAFVRFENVQEAEWCVENLHGNVFEGLTEPLTVKFANQGGAKGSAAGGGPYAAKGAGGPLAPGPVSNAAFGCKGGGCAAEAGPNANLYIKGLPAGMTEENIKETFGSYGTVNSVKVLDSAGKTDDGSGMTVCFVRFEKVQEATWVVENLNGNLFEGLSQPLVVKFANQGGGGKGAGVLCGGKGPGANAANAAFGGKGGCNGGGCKGGGGQHLVPGLPHKIDRGIDQSNLFVKNLPANADELYLYKVFSPFGCVFSVKAVQKGPFLMGFVKYRSNEEAQNAIDNLNGLTLTDGTSLNVSVKTECPR